MPLEFIQRSFSSWWRGRSERQSTTIGRTLPSSRNDAVRTLKSIPMSWYIIELMVCGICQMAFRVEDPVESATIIQMRLVLKMMDVCRMETKKQLTKAYQDKNRVTKLRERKSEETMKQHPGPFEESSRWLTRTYLTINNISSNRFIVI